MRAVREPAGAAGRGVYARVRVGSCGMALPVRRAGGWAGRGGRARLLDSKTTAVRVRRSRSCLPALASQLAHKCILNSFYGYVMRKGAR